MKIVEFRRHSDRVRPSPHLNQQGVDKAREVGEELGDFDLIISSYAPRAIETAVAMGYAIDKIMDEVSMTPDEIDQEVEWGVDFNQYSEVIKQGGKTADYALTMASFVKDIAGFIEEKQSILVVSHGGLIELTAIGCFPDENYVKWGLALDTCEGVRIYIKNDDLTKIELMRV